MSSRVYAYTTSAKRFYQELSVVVHNIHSVPSFVSQPSSCFVCRSDHQLLPFFYALPKNPKTKTPSEIKRVAKLTLHLGISILGAADPQNIVASKKAKEKKIVSNLKLQNNTPSPHANVSTRRNGLRPHALHPKKKLT